MLTLKQQYDVTRMLRSYQVASSVTSSFSVISIYQTEAILYTTLSSTEYRVCLDILGCAPLLLLVIATTPKRYTCIETAILEHHLLRAPIYVISPTAFYFFFFQWRWIIVSSKPYNAQHSLPVWSIESGTSRLNGWVCVGSVGWCCHYRMHVNWLCCIFFSSQGWWKLLPSTSFLIGCF